MSNGGREVDNFGHLTYYEGNFHCIVSDDAASGSFSIHYKMNNESKT